MLAVTFSDVVLSLHVLGVVTAFGVTFAYPVLTAFVRRRQPHAMAALHAAQEEIGRRLVTPSMTVVLVAGVYLATDRELWDRVWVTIPFVVLIVIFGLGGGFFAPQERRLADLAQRDIARAAGATVEFSSEYEALAARVRNVGLAVLGLVVLATFLMVAKPGGYS